MYSLKLDNKTMYLGKQRCFWWFFVHIGITTDLFSNVRVAFTQGFSHKLSGKETPDSPQYLSQLGCWEVMAVNARGDVILKSRQ